MLVPSLVLAAFVAAQAPAGGADRWVPHTSQDGKFVVDFPGKPTKSFTRQSRSRAGQIRTVVVQCDTPDVRYTVQKIELPQTLSLKPADLEAVLDSFRDDLAAEYNGKVVAHKKVRLDSGSVGRDFTIEGKPDVRQGLATIRVREYLSQRVLYMLIASAAADRDLPDDVGHFFASFTQGTDRANKAGPLPEAAGTPFGTWGAAIDPDGDCKIRVKGSALEMAIPNTHHNLNAETNKMNAPRVMQDVTGDFTISVKVLGDFLPGEKSTNPRAIPYIGGGILIWQNSDNYIFLGRAGVNRKGKNSEFVAFEEREWGARGAVNSGGLIPPGGVYVKAERRNNRILGYTSADGKTWKKLEPMEPSYPATLKVGIYGINGCGDPATVSFEDYTFKAEGQSKTPGKKR